jgi:hypothetical protein
VKKTRGRKSRDTVPLTNPGILPSKENYSMFKIEFANGQNKISLPNQTRGGRAVLKLA